MLTSWSFLFPTFYALYLRSLKMPWGLQQQVLISNPCILNILKTIEAFYGNATVTSSMLSSTAVEPGTSDNVTTTTHIKSTKTIQITTPPESPTIAPNCTQCVYNGFVGALTFDWPVGVTTTAVLATVIYHINNVTNTTSTITKYDNITEVIGASAYTSISTADWESMLAFQGVTASVDLLPNGTPIITYKATIATAPGAYTTEPVVL